MEGRRKAVHLYSQKTYKENLKNIKSNALAQVSVRGTESREKVWAKIKLKNAVQRF